MEDFGAADELVRLGFPLLVPLLQLNKDIRQVAALHGTYELLPFLTRLIALIRVAPAAAAPTIQLGNESRHDLDDCGVVPMLVVEGNTFKLIPLALLHACHSLVRPPQLYSWSQS